MVTDSTSQADDTTVFLRAARSGNLEKVVEFLDTDLDINTANSNGLNALHLASKDGHVEIVTELLKRDAKVDAATKKGNTALHIASLAGQSEIVNILIQYGAAVNIQSQNGFTPLYMAAQENHDQVVKLLLSNGANQSLATEDGFTPLAVAMQQGHDKVVSVLLENDSKGKVRLPALHIAAKKDDCKAADLLLQNEHKPDVTSKSGFTPLHIAAHYGNEQIARLLIKRGADVNYLAKHNISPLHVAAKWGKNNMVNVLLEHSAQIDAKTRDGLTPLHCAARSGHEQVISTLIGGSAPISARTKNGLAPLHMASQGDHVDAARVLLFHRAPVDEVTIDYLTSLHVAAHCGHVRVAKLLLDRKADPNARALNGFTPLHIACKKNRIKVVELLLKHGASIESTTESGLTPLHVASFMGCMNIVIFLLQHEANPDVPTVRGETPLHLAARANQTDIIRILLRNGAKVDARAREQQTPLHIASRLGNIDIVMLLLQHGAAVDTTTKDMYTALHIAAKEGQEEVATILVENNASLKATTKNGFTPLHIAAKYGNMSVAKILLQRDCNLDVQGKNDITPLHLACHYDHPNVANLLLEKGASPHLASQNGHTPLHIAARKNQMDIASTLLENGANANAESKSGFTPLHLSSQKGHYDMTNLLIEHGADPNHKSKNGLTALHLCAQEDFVKVASILVKNDANVESETETGYRPIHIAAHFGNLSMIRFLLKHNASIDVKTNQNYTPLHQAAQQGHAHIVTALIEGNASHKARTNDGLTALNIAQKLGYISVMEVLKGLSYDTLAPDNKNWEEKYKVIAPESLQETSFMSDSDDEGGSDALISEQPYRYLTADLMKSLRDDSLPIDVTRDDPVHTQVTKEEKQEFTQSNNYCLAENFDTDGFNLGFLVSFLVDARGGAMKGCRHSGVRIIVPPRRATMPIRVTCRLIKPNKVQNPPPLMEGEALATRIIEMGPIGATFLGPVLIDIPHFASIRGKEREIIILRSENGETWKEHDNSADNDTTLLNTAYDPQMSAAYSGRITRIITTDFPQYFAIVTRIKQEVHVIGAEGGILTSTVANDVQAVFPPGALTKKIKVGLQAHLIPAELTAKLLGNCVAVSPVITIEPRRRKFHKPITLTIPVPQAANKGMINQYGGETPTLRLLCSIAGGTSESQWEDVTGSTPLTFMNDTVSFTTTVSARFWLMDCRNIGAVPKMATELYEESLFVPYITNFVIYSKRLDILEATLRILCMTDGKEGMHTLERQEEFVEIVKSRDVEALDGKDLYIEFSGNLVPVTKSGAQLKFTFKAFRQNRLSFHVKVKDPQLDPVARMLFMREPKIAKGEAPQQPICVLNIVLPEIMTKVEKKVKDSNLINQKLDSYESKYKMEHKEKSDEPKDTSPSEKKFITDTLQKERTDAVTIHEILAQKAACSLESVDASYPSKVVGQEQDLSPSVERQTYSEKRKFWEDISRKRESYQRSESEISRTSQLTINESDSEYTQNVVTDDNTADMVQEMEKSETMEDLNVPDISECSVAEKAQYFEEQIQKETTKVPTKLQQQDSISKSEKVTKTITSEKEEIYVSEKIEMKERKEERQLTSDDEKEKDESKQKEIIAKKEDKPEKMEKEVPEKKEAIESEKEIVIDAKKEEPIPQKKKEEIMKIPKISVKESSEEKEKELDESIPTIVFEETEIEKSIPDVSEKVAKQEAEEIAKVEAREAVTDLIAQERAETPEIKTANIVQEKISGKRVITEETTITYKVQEDGSLVQEGVSKTVQVEGDALTQLPEVERKLIEKSISEGRQEIMLTGKTEDVKREMEKFLERERIAEMEKASREELEEKIEAETKLVKKEFESRIPVSTTKIDKDKPPKETKGKPIVETKQVLKSESDKELHTEDRDISPTTKKKEFESRIPKRVVDAKPEKPGKKDAHVKKDGESYTITEKKSSEEVTSKLEEHLTTKSETQTFSKTFTDPEEAFKMFEDIEKAKSEFATVTSKVDHKTSSMLEKKEVVSSEISSGKEKIITLEEKERVEKKKSSESQLKKESPTETIEEKKSKSEELDKRAIQRMSMNLTDTQEVIDASASESRAETKKEETLRKLSDEEGVTTHEAGSSVLRESDADVAIRIKKDVDAVKTVEGEPTERISKTRFAEADIETLAKGESRKETKESFDVVQFVPSEKKRREDEEKETESEEESLEAKQLQKFKEIEARTIAETLIQSIESEIEAKSAEELKAELLSKGYLEQIISESAETDHEKLADDLTRKFESIMRKSAGKADRGPIDSPRLRSSIQEELSSARDSISEDITKDEESSPHERSSLAKLQDRDITMSPSSVSISEHTDFDIDVDTNELDSVSKPTLSPQSEKQRSTKSSSQVELQRDLPSDASFPRDKVVSEISGARVLEILEPGMDSQSREDSVDMPSLEMDEHKISEQTSRGIPSLHESAGTDSFERLVQERDITISPSTVSEDTNILDYSLVQEQIPSLQREHLPPPISTRRADSFEIESPPLISPKPKLKGLEIKPVNWMIGDEKIEISETLQPSQIFNQELEAYETMRKKERLSSLDSTDHDQESGTKSSEDVSVIESTKEVTAENGRTVVKTKFTVIPVSERDFESELVENKLDVSCQELVDTLQREYEAKTPIDEYREEIAESKKLQEETLQKEERKIEKSSDDENENDEKSFSLSGKHRSDELKREEIVSKLEMELKLEKTAKPEEEKEEVTESDKPARVDDVLKEWTETYLSKMKPSSEDYKRHMEKSTEKHDKPGRSTTVPSDTCAFKIKKDGHPSVDLSARYAITVLDQVVKKEIAEVKESLEAAKQDLIEELNENSETVIQIKDSPSEFRFTLQPESIPNDLPFLYTSELEVPQEPKESEAQEPEAPRSESPVDKPTEIRVEVEESSSSIEEPAKPPVIKTEKSDAEVAAITVHEETKDDEEDRPSPVFMSGSDLDNKDESSSLALPRPVIRRRHKTGRTSKHVASESDVDLGSSSGESSNYQSCDYESGSRPSSSDVEAMQSCGVPSATASEYETAMVSIDRSSKQTSQEYHTAATTMSSRESMKSLTSLSSGHLGSIDSTSELSETLVPSEDDADKDMEENLNGAVEEEQTEQSDSSGSEIPIDEPADAIYSGATCRMKRSSEMIFPQVLDEAARETETDAKGVDSATSTSAMEPGALESVDIMTSRVSEDGVQSVSTQVISTPAATETESTEKEDVPITESELLKESPEISAQTSTPSMMQQASMSTSSTSAVSIDTVVGKEKSDRHSPDSDSFEMVDKPDIIDDFVVIEEVGKEAEEYDSEGKSIRISALPQVSSKQYDRDLENLITEKKEDSQVSTSQTAKNNELFEFDTEESPPQNSNEDQYSGQSNSDDEQYDGKKWIDMQFQAETRAYDIEYDRGPLEDIKEEEITDFEAGSSRFGSLGSRKESIGSVGSMRGSFGSTPEFDVLAGKKYFTRPSDHDNVSLSSLQEFENLESAVAAENSKKLQCGSHDSASNGGSLPKRYTASRSGHGDDVSLSSLKDFEGLETACREAHLIELRAREEEDLLEHESPENKYKLESMPRARVDTSAAGSFNASTSGSDDYEKRIKEIDEIIRIAQSNVEKFDRQDDTTDDVSQIEITDADKVVSVQPLVIPEEAELSLQRESNVMETSTDSLELEDNMDNKHHPLCRSSDSLEMKTTLDFPSLSSDSLNNVRDAKETQSDVAEHAADVRRISSDSLDMPLLDQQDRERHEDDHSEGIISDNSLEQRPDPAETDKARTTPSTTT